MKLGTLLAGIEVVGDFPAELDTARVVADSRQVGVGDVFVAVVGQHTDGHAHVHDAAARGARAVVVEREVELGPQVAVVRVASTRQVLGPLAARAAGYPSRGLRLVGITGTNGKTTVSYLLEAIWNAQGWRAGVVGTLGSCWNGRQRSCGLTTPEAPELQSILAQMAADGIEAVALEVSSHALELGRVRGCEWDGAVFTNLGRDHLDFHHDAETYYLAKSRLFRELLPATTKPEPFAVIGIDTTWGERLASEASLRKLTFGRRSRADVRPLEVSTGLGGTRAVVATPAGPVTLESSLIGWPHVENLLAAVATALAQGIPTETIAAGVRACRGPRGRLECFGGPGFSVVVDYAHTPDALRAVLDTLRALGPGRLITVFGCGGDRDRGKRPIMGRVAAELSSLVVLTSDNPRSEDPLRILAETEAGVTACGMPSIGPAALAQADRGYCVEPDRRMAIALAVRAAREGDIVLVAGKGHEDYQIVGDRRYPLDDREEVRRQIAAAAAAAARGAARRAQTGR